MTQSNDGIFDEATGVEYVKVRDIDGRAILVWATGKGSRRGNDGNQYDYVECDVVVLDGADTEKFTVGELIQLQFTTESIVSQLRRNLVSGRPRLGLISSRPSKYNDVVRAYSFDPISEDHPARARVGAAVALRSRSLADVAQDPF